MQDEEYEVIPVNNPDPDDTFTPVEMSNDEARARLNELFMEDED